jgi:preprotein translocase subunit SecD
MNETLKAVARGVADAAALIAAATAGSLIAAAILAKAAKKD